MTAILGASPSGRPKRTVPSSSIHMWHEAARVGRRPADDSRLSKRGVGDRSRATLRPAETVFILAETGAGDEAADVAGINAAQLALFSNGM